MTHIVVENVRGYTVESRHDVSVAVVDARGRVVAQAGNPFLTTFMRSAAKPFQAIPLVADGVMQRFAVSPEELALAVASHNSEPDQVDRVRAFLGRIGCGETDLACGPHRPLWRDLARLAPGEEPDPVPRSPLASNCSGKHTAMLALARHHGWPPKGYQESGHPVQQRVREEVVRFTGVPDVQVEEGIDGCGVVSFALPLAGMARGYARLVASGEEAPRAIVAAMRGFPELVAGRGRLCTRLMQQFPTTIAKVGAEGVYAAALTDRRWGIALKVEDGHSVAAAVAVIAVLDQLGIEPRPSDMLPEFAQWPVVNTRGKQVGRLRPMGRLAFL